ncbi:MULTISPECIES: AraC family transcriptional regulator [unclassified Zymobacter]|uniref:AraC-like transcriptional regulator QhpR n=1 Tax=unclassified Zymobacter TaxID=3048685 RepID=UPI0039C4A1A1
MAMHSFQSALAGAFAGVPVGHRGVLSAAASGLGDFIGHCGGDIDHIFGISGIDPELLGSPTLSLGLVNYCRVMEEAARSSGEDNFGLYYGRQFKPQALGLIGYIGLCSPTLEQALRNVVNAFPCHQHDTLTRLVDQGECLRLDYQVHHGAILARRQDAELTLGMFLNLIRYVLGPQWAAREVQFEHPRPEGWHEHCKVFDAPVYFEQPFNSLLIPKRDLGRTMPDSDPLLLAVMQDAIRRLNDRAPHQGIVDQARNQIHLLLAQGPLSLERVADNMGISPWSLQRRLREEGTCFTQMIDTVRRELAEYLLPQRQLPLSDIALQLGYSELSAFSRAFQRWYGTSPRKWRQALHLERVS